MSEQRATLSLRDLLVIGLCAVAFVSLRTVLRLPVHLPGHNAAIFTLFLVVATGAVGRPPAGSLMGAASGALAVLVGIGTNDGPAVVIRYALPGLLADILLYARRDLGRAGWAVLLGAMAALIKLSVSLSWAWMIGQPADWLLAKVAVGGPVHALSGGLGGWVGGLLVARLRRAGLVRT